MIRFLQIEAETDKMSRKVLIVDDVLFVRKTIADIFIKKGFHVVGEASNARDALKMYKEFKPDLVTMDVVMPGRSGIDATKDIIALDKEARVIIISAMEHENLVMDAINAGARDYIIKPFKESEILKSVDKIFGK